MTETLGWIALAVGVPLNLYVVWRLLRLARASANPVLRERAGTATVVLITVTVFGLIFVNNDTLPPPLDPYVTKVITRAAMDILAIVPALYWLNLYRRATL